MTSSPSNRPLRVAGVALVAALVLAACAAVEGDDIGSPIFDGTTPDGVIVEPPITTLPPPDIDAIRVPVDFFSIQDAVDAAQPGDLILLDPGVYSEEIVVNTSDVVIRGRDRNTVFVDGLHSAGTGVTVRANGVALENLTVRNYQADGIVVESLAGPPLDGFRALHVTTSNTGANGIVVRNAVNVEVREVWASGHGQAGVAIEGCVDCRTLIETTLAEFSARGLSISGATGSAGTGVTVVRSTARNNRVGIVVTDAPGTSSQGVTVAGSVIVNNGFTSTPRQIDEWDHAFGVGLHVSGTADTVLDRNRVSGNTRAGFLLGSRPDGAAADPVATVVTDNEITGHPEGDVVFAFTASVSDPGLCLRGNLIDRIEPPSAAAAAACSPDNTPPDPLSWSGAPGATIPYQNGPVPPGIEGLPDADGSPPIPAGPVAPPDLTAVVVPAA